MHIFTQLFLLALGLGLLIQAWLLWRHRQHVSAHQGQVPTAFADAISLDEHQKAARYTLARAKAAGFELISGTLLLLFWTLGGGLNWLYQAWVGSGLSTLSAGTAFILSAFFIMGLLDIPVSAWRTFSLETRFGFNRTTPRRFVADLLTQTGLMFLIGLPLIWILLWIMGSAGSLWWLAAWAVWITFTLLITWAYPTFIAPLFNKFEPLADAELQERIQQLLTRCGFSSNGIFVMDGSQRSSHGNAYFTGLGRSKRIVFFDTLLESLSADEMEAVLAHELGHFKCKHVLKRMLTMSLTSLIGLALLGWLSQQDWFYSALGMQQASDAAALLLFLMAIPVFTQFLQPLSSWLMRRQEFEADDYAIEQTSPEAMIQALVKLYRENASTLTPDPLYSAYHDSHPPAPIRVSHITAST
ncbi:MAG: M48 family metallopeptidase [Candidatus Polarisedimenticolaceae bacterium]|nr:M48 family metallopeptidase [Candidatus Polarisedimenticolaceae bacterium]